MTAFAYTILYVEDVAQSLHFYEQAFGLERKFLTPENDYGELKSGSTTLSFASLSLAHSNLKNGFQSSSPNQKPFGIELGFTTNEVAATMAKAIAAGASEEEPLVEKPWGQQVGYLRDPNGFLLEVCSPMGE